MSCGVRHRPLRAGTGTIDIMCGVLPPRSPTTLQTARDRMLAVRLTDRVRPVREAATKAVLRRTSLAQADRITPVLHLIEGRTRGAEALPLYLHALAGVHGEATLWSRLRCSATPEVRRAAFRCPKPLERGAVAGVLNSCFSFVQHDYMKLK